MERLPEWQEQLKKDLQWDIQNIVDDYLQQYSQVEVNITVDIKFHNRAKQLIDDE